MTMITLTNVSDAIADAADAVYEKYSARLRNSPVNLDGRTVTVDMDVLALAVQKYAEADWVGGFNSVLVTFNHAAGLIEVQMLDPRTRELNGLRNRMTVLEASGDIAEVEAIRAKLRKLRLKLRRSSRSWLKARIGIAFAPQKPVQRNMLLRRMMRKSMNAMRMQQHRLATL